MGPKERRAYRAQVLRNRRFSRAPLIEIQNQNNMVQNPLGCGATCVHGNENVPPTRSPVPISKISVRSTQTYIPRTNGLCDIRNNTPSPRQIPINGNNLNILKFYI